MKAKIALAIGGLDPSGGAGVTGDVVTFAVIGVHGATVATALTYQNTSGVIGFWAVGERDLRAQMDAVVNDMDVAAVKLGMVASEAVARALEPYLAEFRERGIPVVFDPVIRAGTGQPLFEGVAEKTFADVILPRVTLVTPNAFELAYLIGDEPARNLGDLRTQVRVFHSRFGLPALATGGHVGAESDAVVDVLFTGTEMREHRRSRVAGEIHGTGCLFAAAVTAYLALGLEIVNAFERAEEYVTAAVQAAFAAGRGNRLPDRTAAIFGDAERWRVYNNVLRAVDVFIKATNTYKLIPEVGTNIAYALPDARTPDEVCAVPGRIIRVAGELHTCRDPGFGASSHMARGLLAVMKHDPSVRAVLNVKFGEEVLSACAELNYRVGSFDRGSEPPETAGEEGQTMQWGIDQAVAAAEGVPDVIYDRGAFGKEPMVRIFGRDAMEAVRRAVAVSRRV